MGTMCQGTASLVVSSTIIVIFLVSNTSGQSNLCNNVQDCVTDLRQSDCDRDNQYFIPNSTVCNMCPTCQSRAGIGQMCMSNENCAPGLRCEGIMCALDSSNCLSAIRRHAVTPIKSLPNCNPDGTWQPVQCKGDPIMGRCFCSSSTGRRIFGISWAVNSTDMTCANRPDIVLVDHSKNTTYIVDVTIPHDENLQKAERDKILKYMDLAHEIKDMWRTPATIVVPIVISTNGLIPKSLHANLCKVGVDGGLKYLMQKAVLLSTCRTLPCSRHRHELEQGGRNDVTLHCSENGNYEPLQCDSGLCWCAEVKTGKPTSTIVKQDLVTQLPCYDSSKFGSQYLRRCESKEYGIAVMRNKLAVHGTTQVRFGQSFCDYDGTFGVYQIDSGNAYCTWKDASRLGSWATQAGANLISVTCNCARDSRYFQLVGQEMTQTCEGNGNYMKLQELNGQLYCVDDDGYPTTDPADMGVVLDCSIYA